MLLGSHPDPAEVLIPLREFCRLFERNQRHCQRRIKAGAMKEATKIAGRWYVFVSKRAAEAAKRRADSKLDTESC